MNNKLDYPYKFLITQGNELAIVKSGCQEEVNSIYPNVGDGDLAMNLQAVDTIYKLNRSTEQGFQTYPIVLSDRDIANITTIPAPFPEYKFLLLNREQEMDCLNLSIAYYACLVNLLHTSICNIDWKHYVLGNPEKHVDFWLLVKEVSIEQEQELLNTFLNQTRHDLGFSSIKNSTFHIVDAVAAIGSVFDMTTIQGLNQLATIEDEKDLINYPNLALKWVAKHPGCFVKKYISKSLPVWQKHYQKHILAEPPLSEAMQKLVDKEIIKSA